MNRRTRTSLIYLPKLFGKQDLVFFIDCMSTSFEGCVSYDLYSVHIILQGVVLNMHAKETIDDPVPHESKPRGTEANGF